MFDCLYVDYYPKVDWIVYHIGNQTTKLQSVSLMLKIKKSYVNKQNKNITLTPFKQKYKTICIQYKKKSVFFKFKFIYNDTRNIYYFKNNFLYSCK